MAQNTPLFLSFCGHITDFLSGSPLTNIKTQEINARFSANLPLLDWSLVRDCKIHNGSKFFSSQKN